MSNYHVTKRLYEWAAIKENAERVSGYFSTQAEAEKQAKVLSSHSGGGEVRIHGLDGRIRDSDTVKPAHDQFPPRDKRH